MCWLTVLPTDHVWILGEERRKDGTRKGRKEKARELTRSHCIFFCSNLGMSAV